MKSCVLSLSEIMSVLKSTDFPWEEIVSTSERLADRMTHYEFERVSKESNVFKVCVEMPGVKKEDVDVKIDGMMVLVSFCKPDAVAKRNAYIYIDEYLNKDSIVAKLEDGILTIEATEIDGLRRKVEVK